MHDYIVIIGFVNAFDDGAGAEEGGDHALAQVKLKPGLSNSRSDLSFS